MKTTQNNLSRNLWLCQFAHHMTFKTFFLKRLSYKVMGFYHSIREPTCRYIFFPSIHFPHSLSSCPALLLEALFLNSKFILQELC